MSDITVTVARETEEGRTTATAVTQVADLLSRAGTQFRKIADAEATLRVNQLDDLHFRASEQWDAQSITDRDSDGRPRLTINRLGQFIRQVTNAQRAANLAIEVLPVDDKADGDTAEVFQGIIRNIENQSDAQVAYSTAGDHQATIGRGYWRIVAEYTDNFSFTQELRIKRVRNPFMVYMDTAVQELDYMDATMAFVVEDLDRDLYLAKYPDSKLASLTNFTSPGADLVDWVSPGKIRIAEYWWTEWTDDVIVLISLDGHEEVLTLDAFQTMPASLQGKIVEKTRRTVRTKQIKMAIINAVEVLEGNEDLTDGRVWPGQWIPIIPVIGDEIDINGKVDYRGMVRDAKDPQRLYNFQNSALAEVLSLAPLSQWVGYAGQFEGHEKKWLQANRRRFPYLEVNAFDVAGKPVGLPQRISAEPPIVAIVQAIRQADNDLKATTGLFDPSLGQRGPQQSGKAITALKEQGELANSNFLDNLGRAIRATGKMLVDLIPSYYDAPRIIRILGNDDTKKTVLVHAGATDLPTEIPGVEGIYDLSVGRYDVTFAVGPSYATKRQEASRSLNEFIQVYPAAFPVLGDLIVKNMDWAGSKAAAARLHKMVPPQFLDEAEGGPPPVPPEVQQQIEAMQAQLTDVSEQLSNATRIIESKQVEQQSITAIKREEIASKERIAALDAKIEMTKLHDKAAQDQQMVALKAEVDRIDLLLTQAHDLAKIHHETAQSNYQQDRDRADAQAQTSRDAQAHTSAAAATPASKPPRRQRIERDANGLITAIVEE
jgi:hypothetical protein